MNTKLREKAKNNFEKTFFKLMNNAVFGKTMENVRKHRNIKLRKEKYLFSIRTQFSYYKFFYRNLLAIEMRKTQILTNKPVYLGLSILDISKTVMYEFQCDYVKPKYGENAKRCHVDTDSYIVHVKTDDILQKMLKQDQTIQI